MKGAACGLFSGQFDPSVFHQSALKSAEEAMEPLQQYRALKISLCEDEICVLGYEIR